MDGDTLLFRALALSLLITSLTVAVAVCGKAFSPPDEHALAKACAEKGVITLKDDYYVCAPMPEPPSHAPLVLYPEGGE